MGDDGGRAEAAVLAVLGRMRVIAYCPNLVAVVGGNSATEILLAQIMFWMGVNPEGKRRATIERGGKLWVAKTLEQWSAETGLGVRTCQAALLRLKAIDVIRTETRRFHGVNTLHVTLRWEVMLGLLKASVLAERPLSSGVGSAEEGEVLCGNDLGVNDGNRHVEMTFFGISNKEEITSKNTNPYPPTPFPGAGEVQNQAQVLPEERKDQEPATAEATAKATTAAGRGRRRGADGVAAIEHELGSAAGMLEAEVETVLEMCKVALPNRRQRAAVRAALEFAVRKTQCGVGEAGERAVRSWNEYLATPMAYRVGVRMFFAGEWWMDRRAWPVDRAAMDRYSDATVGMR